MKRRTCAQKFLILSGLVLSLGGCRLDDNSIRGVIDGSGNLLPTIKIVSGPADFDNTTNLNISLTGESVSLDQYRYKIGPAGSTDCSDPTGYSSAIDISTNITDNISGLADGLVKVCIIGRSLSGTWQEYTSATSKTWTKDTGVPNDPSTWSLASPVNGSTSNDNTPQFSDNAIVGEDGSFARVYSDVGCTTQIGSATISGGSFTINNVSLATNGTDDGILGFYGRIIDRAGNESNCTDMTLGYTFDTQGPTAPTGLSLGATPGGLTTTPTLSWTAGTDPGGSGVASHEAQIYRASDNAVIQTWTTLVSGNSFSGLSLSDGVAYYMRVRAVDNASNLGAEAQSANWTAVLAPASWVAGLDDTGRVAVSADGITWSEVDINAVIGASSIKSIAYGQGRWILTAANLVATSTDGHNWSLMDVTAAIASGVIKDGVHYSSEADRWMLGGSNYPQRYVATSTDGTTWSAPSDLDNETDADMAPNSFHYARGTWAVARYSGRVAVSTDNGVNWTYKSTVDGPVGGSGVIYANGVWLKATSGTGGTHNYSRMSTDGGVNWNAVDYIASGGTQFGQAAYGNDVFGYGDPGFNYNRFVEILTSTPTTLTIRSVSPAVGNFLYSTTAFGDGLWVMGRTNAEIRTTTTDFNNWTIRASGLTDTASFIAYGGLHNTPDAFTITDQTGVATSTAINSNVVSIDNHVGSLKVFAGNGAQVCINDTDSDLSNGCSTGFVAGDGTGSVSSGDTVGFQMTSSASNSTEKVSTIQIGTRIYHWSVTTTP